MVTHPFSASKGNAKGNHLNRVLNACQNCDHKLNSRNVCVPAEIVDDALSSLKLVVILPTALIQTIVEGTPIDSEEHFPMRQIHYALSLPQALYKVARRA